MKTISLLIILASGWLSAAYAQVVQPERIEIEIGDMEEDFFVVSADEQGLILFREVSDDIKIKGKNAWEFIKFNTSLEKEWAKVYGIDYNHQLLGYDYENGQLVLLYRNGPYYDRNMTLINMGINAGDTTVHNIRRIIPMMLSYFEIVGQTVVLGGEVNYKPAVMHYDLLTRKIKVLPGIYGDRGELLDIQPNDQDQTLDVLMAEMLDDKRVTVNIKAFDQYSNLLQDVPLLPRPKTNLLDAQVSEFEGQKQNVAGTYGPRRSKYSRGLFFATITPDGRQQIEYYNYGDLKNFFGYMKPKREQRIKDRIARKKSKGKKIKMNYRVVVHELVADKGKYIMLAEAYYPRYNNGYYRYYGSYGSSYNNLYFDGYRYTHAVVVCFDERGNMMWDHSFELDNARSMELEQLVQINMQKDNVVLMYSYEGDIKTKVIDKKGDIVEENFDHPIRLANESDELRNKRDSEIDGIEKWYDNYFFIHGVQKIRNQENQGLSYSRKVFFINKVAYEHDKMVFNK